MAVPVDFQDIEKVKEKEFQEKLEVLLNEYKYLPVAKLIFPKYKILPDEVNLALKVIDNQGGVLEIGFVPIFPK